MVNNICAIIQARMGSERLPGKVLKKIGSLTMLENVVLRAKQSRLLDDICVATSQKEEDLAVADAMKGYDVKIFRGDEEDVLSRYDQAADFCDCKIIVRITADCPLIDPTIIDYAIKELISGGFDYLSNTIERTYPRGMDVEVFTREVLKKATRHANERFQREHVTPYIWQNGHKFKIGQIKADIDHSMYRLTVDTEEDYKLAREVYDRAFNVKGNSFGYKDLVDILKKEPHLVEINREIRQKH